MNRIPPQDIMAEESLISAILLDKEIMEDISFLTPIDFYLDKHKLVFKAALDLFNKNEPVDIVTVVNKLKQNGNIDEIGGASTIAKMVDTVPMAVNAIHYAKIIKDKSTLRKVIKEFNTISSMCFEEQDNAEVIIDHANNVLSKISEGQSNEDDIESNSGTAHEFLQEIEKNKDSGGVTGLLTGINRLDFMLGGLQPSDLIILAARPSMGKSSLCINIAQKVSESNGHTLIMSYETKRKKICARIVSNLSKINSRRFRTGEFSESEWSRLSNASSYFSEMNITIDDSGKKNVAGIRRLALKLKKEKDLKLIVIDYLGRMPIPKADRHDLAIGSITSDLKGLCNELDIPIVLLSQLNRKLEDRDNKRPRMSDLRDSGSIEQDADVVAFLYREIVYKKEADPEEAEIIISKNRDGEIGMVKAKYVKELTTFYDFPVNSLTNQ